MSEATASKAIATVVDDEETQQTKTPESKSKTNEEQQKQPKQRNKDSDGAATKDSRVRLPSHMEPTFYIGGGNGVAIIEEACANMGWKRITAKTDDSYRFKWCELKSQINYYTFKEGDQMVNHIPNCNLLTNKLGLLNSLQEYDRVCQTFKKRVMRLDFIPETFRLDDPRDRNVFRQTYQEAETWICKPTGKNQGKGIFIVKSQEEVNKIFEEQEERTQDGKPLKPLNRIIQRYLSKPLLLNKKKFDIRCYMLIASTVPYLVLYHKGYIRLTISNYDSNTDNLIAHLTNQYIQRKDPTYKDVKEETTWSMDKFNDYLNEHYIEEKGIEKDWALNALPVRIKQIMSHCFTCVKSRLQCKVGYHDLYGFDFMIDEDMKIWLIEVNVNPSLSTNCEALKEVVPSVVKETIHIANECFEKSRKGRQLLPINSIEGFEIVYSNASKTQRKSVAGSPYRKEMISRAENRLKSAMRRSTVTASPQKEPAIVAPTLDANVQQISRSNTQYAMNKQTTLNSKNAVARVRNTPIATPTIVTPGSGLPVPQRSTSFAQLRGAGPPANAASSLKVTQSSTSVLKTPLLRTPSRHGPTNSKPSETSNSAATPGEITKPTGLAPKSAKQPRATSNSPNPYISRNSSSRDTSKSTNNAPVKSSLKPVQESSEPPHHHKIKKELRNKMTATEVIIIRNITKQNLSTRKSHDATLSVRTKSTRSSVSETSGRSRSSKIPTPPKANDKKQTERRNVVQSSPRHSVRTPRNYVESESDENVNDDDDDEVSSDSEGDETLIEMAKAQSMNNTNHSNNQVSVNNVRESFTPVPVNSDTKSPVNDGTQSPNGNNVEPKKITLHMSPHGTRGSKDGGKPTLSMRFAAMYPSSPYVDQPVLPIHSQAVPQLRMTHNGKIPKPKRVKEVTSEHEKPNRGS